MNLKVVMCAVLALAGNFAVGVARATDLPVCVVSNVEELLAAGSLIASSSDGGGQPVKVKVLAGTYLLKDSFRIGRSHVSLIGEQGAKFVLANNVNEPVIVVGSQQEKAGPEQVVTDIVITGLEIDGNKENQSSEFSARRPWIRNNGIDVRDVTRLAVANVVVNNNRSGGLVISWGCSDVRVTNSTFAKNFFDGVAFYASSNVEVNGCTMTGNHGAGVSLDNEFVDSRFVRCIIDSNRDVGVFARSSARLEFKDCVVRHSGNWAFFLAHDDRDRGVFDIVITGGQISDNRGGVCVASINEKQSHGTRVVGATFASNGGTGRRNIQTSGSLVATAEIAETDGAKLPAVNLATIH